MKAKHLAMLMELAYPSGMLVEEYEEAAEKILSAHKSLLESFPKKPVQQEPILPPVPETKAAEAAPTPAKNLSQLFMDGYNSRDEGFSSHVQLLELANAKTLQNMSKPASKSKKRGPYSKKPKTLPPLTLIDKEVLRVLGIVSSHSREDQVSELQKAVWKRWPNCAAVERVKKSLDRLFAGGEVFHRKNGSYEVRFGMSYTKDVPEPSVEEVVKPVEVGKRASPRPNLEGRVLDYLKKERIGVAGDIVTFVSGFVSKKSPEYFHVTRTLSRLVSKGEIVRVKYGVYAATKEEADVLNGKS